MLHYLQVPSYIFTFLYQMLFPLFGQLDCAKEETIDDDKSLW